jgi:hypothetical protein
MGSFTASKYGICPGATVSTAFVGEVWALTLEMETTSASQTAGVKERKQVFICLGCAPLPASLTASAANSKTATAPGLFNCQHRQGEKHGGADDFCLHEFFGAHRTRRLFSNAREIQVISGGITRPAVPGPDKLGNP